MKKLFIIFPLTILSLFGYSQIDSYRFYFDDNAKMETDTFNLTVNIDFNRPDYYNQDSVEIKLVKLKSIKNLTYHQQVFSQNIVPINCAVKIKKESIDEYGNTIQTIGIKSMSNASFGLDVNYSLANVTTFKQFADCPYSITSKLPLSDSVKVFLKESDEIQSTADTVIKLAKQITTGCVTSAQMVENIVKWMSENLTYDFTLNHDIQDAISVINNKTGICEGYSNLMCAMLRSLGIASRRANGYLTNAPIIYQTNGKTYTETSSGGGHAWVEVFYPSLNAWVSTEPQSNSNFIYPNYIVYNNTISATLKSVLTFASVNIQQGSDSYSYGSITNSKVYSTNTNSTKNEQLPSGVKFAVLMTLFTTEGTDCVDTTTQKPTTVNIETPELVKIYPNPATNIINVDFSSLAEENAMIKIVNQLGSTLYEKSIVQSGNQIESIPVSGFSSGVYFVIIQTAGATRTVAFSVNN